MLVVRPLDGLDATVLVQSQALVQFVSPDGAWLGFNDQEDNTIKRTLTSILSRPSLVTVNWRVKLELGIGNSGLIRISTVAATSPTNS